MKLPQSIPQEAARSARITRLTRRTDSHDCRATGDQDNFDAVWTLAGETMADELADKYGHGWIHLLVGRKVGGQTTPLTTVRPL